MCKNYEIIYLGLLPIDVRNLLDVPQVYDSKSLTKKMLFWGHVA